MVPELTADAFLEKDVATDIWEELEKQKPLQKTTTPEPEVSEEEESFASSIDTRGDDVEPEHLADIHRIETCKLATRKTKKSLGARRGPSGRRTGRAMDAELQHQSLEIHLYPR